MASLTDDGRPTGEPAPPVPLEPPQVPVEVLFPNLNRVSRSSFRAGTLSRRRIVRAGLLLLSVVGVIAVLVLVSVLT